jgi:ABC-type transport system involved in multi-copper enzyme maturation permease subunit
VLGLSGAGILLDPLTRKEIGGFARRWQTYLGRVVYVGLIGLIVFDFWRSMTAEARYVSVSEYASLGRRLFETFFWLQFVFVSLASVFAASDLVTREANAGTLGLLVLTPLTPRAIAFGKWKAALTQSAALLLCGAPVLAICAYLGGVGPWEIAWSFSVTLGQAAMGSALGLRASALCRTATRAVLMGVLAVLAFALAPILLLFMGGVPALFLAPFLHPLYAAVAATASSGRGSEFLAGAWVTATPASFALAWLVVRSVAKEIDRRIVAGPDRVTVHREMPTLETYYTRAPGRARRSLALRGGVWEDRPLLWKELATRAAGRLRPETRTTLLLLSFFFIAGSCVITEGKALGFFYFLASLFLLLATAAGASLFAPEKEGRRLEMLLSTPLTAGQIVRTKLLAGVAAPESLLVLALWGLTVVGWSWWSGVAGVLIFGTVSTLFLAFTYLLAAAASLKARSVRGAFLFTSGVVLLILVGLPFFRGLIDFRSGREPAIGWLLRWLDPLVSLEAFEQVPPPFRASPPRPREFPEFALAYGVAIVALVLFMVRGFDRAAGRR